MAKSRFLITLFACIFLLGSVSAIYSVGPTSVRDTNYQNYPSVSSYSSADLNTYWPILGQSDTCQDRQDVLLQVSAAGCQPTVVRSDLLEEQNVPVLCQLDALEINPLIDIKTIDSISFRGTYPKEVASTGFYPARAALTNRDQLLGNPLINNIGYVVVVLRKQANESALPDSVNLNLTARIKYDAYNALGIGQATFILPDQTDTEFKNSTLVDQSFWQGRYSIKADQVTTDYAVLSIFYQGRKLTTVKVERGKQSQNIYIPGFSTCQAAMKVAYDGYDNSGEDRARIEVTNAKGTDSFDVYKGMRFANSKCTVTRLSINTDGTTGDLQLACDGTRVDLSLRGKVASTPETVKSDATKQYESYVKQALTEYKQVIEQYSTEADAVGGITYGEQALQSALDLAYEAGFDDEYQNFLSVYEQKYPQSDITYYKNRQVANVDRSNAAKVVDIDNTYSTIKLIGFTGATKKPSVDLTVAGKAVTSSMQSPTVYNPTGSSTSSKDRVRIILKSIDPEQVTFNADCPAFYTTTREFSMQKGESQTICGQVVRVNTIKADKLAIVRVLPNIQNTETETNVTVNIGIEKRAIQLSPDKAKTMIDNLNKSIQKWEGISNTLGKAVTGLKTACFSTAAVLTAKNFISGIDGTALARKQVMEGNNGWSARCTEAFRSKQPISGTSHSAYVSVDDCLRQNGDAIDNDVSAAKDAIKSINERISDMEESNGFVQETKTFGEVVSTDKSAEANLAYLKQAYKSNSAIGSIVSSLPDTAYKDGTISYEQMKSLEYNALIIDSDASDQQKQAARNSIAEIKKSVDASLQSQKVMSDFKASVGASYSKFSSSNVYRSENSVIGVYGGETYKADSSLTLQGASAGAPIERLNYNGNEYIAVLSTESSAQNSRVIRDLYQYDASTKTATKVTDPKLSNDIKSKFPTFTLRNENSYMNPYKNPEVQFHETEPYKGTPAVVPVDTKEGWYAGTQQVLPVLGQQAAVQTSGKVSSFWLCNVGENGMEEFDKSNFGDDICQQFNFNTGQATNKFPGLSEAKAQSLVNKAISRLNEASRQYSSGLTQVLFDNNERLKVGNPATAVTAARCQDYMSPKECQLLFNVCDPVICPSSRCNLGGQYYVSNVPETGIVGSALLCLPNAKEGIAVPVCLTGLQAGADGFISIMKSHRDCLSEQLATGKTVGICDQIYSVYMCEFFWKQAAPLAQLLVPKLISSAYGQDTRGGGEYLTVMNAWQRTQDSISYFTQQYAVNSMQAFKVRSVEEAGGEFCKAFASVKAPSSLSALVEPDSPPQFHAYFSSTKFSDITVPATSQYKVFYHIYAGKDSGVSYQVYLKNTDGTSFYNTPQTVLVATGFVTKGEYASQSKDFTAPEGYKELCVRVNGEDNCGFGQVSTSFAVNYVTDEIRSSELTRTDITSESACTSGTVGSSVSLSLNAQSVVESTVNPKVYEAGIVRICGKLNPGSTTDPARYTDVGYCGDTAIRCWLDTESVSRSITVQNAGTRNETLSDLKAIADNALVNAGVFIGNDEAIGELSAIGTDITSLKNSGKVGQEAITSGASIISRIETLNGKIYLNQQTAKLKVLKADTYNAIASRIRPVSTTAADPAAVAAAIAENKNTAAQTQDSASKLGDSTGTQKTQLETNEKEQAATNAAATTGKPSSGTSSSSQPLADVTFGAEFLKNAKAICLIDEPSVTRTAVGVGTGSIGAANYVTSEILNAPGVSFAAGSEIVDGSGTVLYEVWESSGRNFVLDTKSYNTIVGEVNSAGKVVPLTSESTIFLKANAPSSFKITPSVLEGNTLSVAKGSAIIDRSGVKIGEYGADFIVEYKGVWRFIPQNNKIVPYLIKLAPVLKVAGGALDGWGAVCSGVNVYLAVDEFNQMVTAIDQAAASAQAYEAQMSTFTKLPKTTMDNLAVLDDQLSYLQTIAANGKLATYCPGVSESDISGTLDRIHALPKKLSQDANTIASIYNTFMTNTEFTDTYIDPVTGQSSTISTIVDDATGSRISLEEGRKLSRYVTGWYGNWSASGGKELAVESQTLIAGLYSCLAVGGDVQIAVQNSYDLRQALNELEGRTGKYSDNKEVVDKIYNNVLLTSDEYKEISGDGVFNTEESISYVRDLLISKLIYENNKKGTTNVVSLLKEKEGAKNEAGQYVLRINVDGYNSSLYGYFMMTELGRAASGGITSDDRKDSLFNNVLGTIESSGSTTDVIKLRSSASSYIPEVLYGFLNNKAVENSLDKR